MVVSNLALLTAARNKTVVGQPPNLFSGGRSNYLYMSVATKADDAPAWGTHSRDLWLRTFWKTENMLASGVYSMSSRYAAYEWDLVGLPKACARVRDVLHNSEHGKGWTKLILPVIQDMLTQDNGAWIEIVREEDAANSPCIQLNHLDTTRCTRTGDWDTPIIYSDILGHEHKMKWYQVIELTEFPSAEENARGMQLCAVSRLLRAAQIMRDIAIYQHEKVSGQFNRQLNIVSGVSKTMIDDALESQRIEASSQGLNRYILPVIMTALDPRANLTKTTIDLASLPEGFDPEVAMRLYTIQLALAFGSDPQDIAPLPGHNLGSSAQSQMLHQKGRGKGAALFMSIMEQELNYQGIMPRSVTFKYKDQDDQQDKDKEAIRAIRATRLGTLVKAGILTAEVAARILVDNGDLEEKYLPLLSYKVDTNDDIVISNVGPIVNRDNLPPIQAKPKPITPQATGPAPSQLPGSIPVGAS